MDELLKRIRGDFEIVCEPVHVGQLSFDFYRVADPDSLLTEDILLQTHEQLPWQPYWAESWDTAHGVACELADRELAGKNVLDLGCGLGLTGTVAAACGANVVMADYAPPALPFARLNSWPFRDRVEVQQVDWRTDRLNRRFDLIVGSDILYDRNDLPFLNDFWHQHLRPDGSVLLGDPTRALTNEMLAWIRAQTWQVAESQRTTPLSSRPIRLVELRSA